MLLIGLDYRATLRPSWLWGLLLMGRRIWKMSLTLCAVICTGAASAQSSTETYTYDALGRLTKVEVSGGQNNGDQRDLTYDPAGNRTAHVSSCSVNCAPAANSMPASVPDQEPAQNPDPDLMTGPDLDTDPAEDTTLSPELAR